MAIALDYLSHRYPVSIKGIVSIDGKVPLLQNERAEWELPGGKLEPEEQPEACVCREIEEELNLIVECKAIVDAWLYRIDNKNLVVIITYICNLLKNNGLRVSSEHKKLQLFLLNEIPSLNMPQGYKNSISRWLRYF